jgi:hypothetical protein
LDPKAAALEKTEVGSRVSVHCGATQRRGSIEGMDTSFPSEYSNYGINDPRRPQTHKDDARKLRASGLREAANWQPGAPQDPDVGAGAIQIRR